MILNTNEGESENPVENNRRDACGVLRALFQDDERLLEAVVASGDPADAYKKRNWETIAANCYGHSADQCEVRRVAGIDLQYLALQFVPGYLFQAVRFLVFVFPVSSTNVLGLFLDRSLIEQLSGFLVFVLEYVGSSCSWFVLFLVRLVGCSYPKRTFSRVHAIRGISFFFLVCFFLVLYNSLFFFSLPVSSFSAVTHIYGESLFCSCFFVFVFKSTTLQS